jgi:type IV secretory pathway VirD2 relaxase
LGLILLSAHLFPGCNDAVSRCNGGTVADDREFEPRLGRIRSGGGGRGKTYLQRVLRAVSLAGSGRIRPSGFTGSRIGRGFGTGRVLASRDRLAAFRSRRVIIKTRIVKMRGTGAKAAALHLRYIQRDGVTREGAPGELYGRDTDRADSGEFLKRVGGDRHQFRFIVSAEDAGEYQDLKPFVRKLMARMEADLGTALDWVAVDHHNTGHPHTHIVLRGRDDLGQDLVIARDYIAHGMRERAAEIVTLDFGPRSDIEIEDRFARQVGQERLTDLDRLLRRAASPDGEVTLTDAKDAPAHHRTGRLQTLGRLGLAEEIAPGRWTLSADMEATLRAMGERGDIIKTMHRELAANGLDRGHAELSIFGVTGTDVQAVTGRVIAQGLRDEKAGTHYLVVDGTDGKVYYAHIAEGADAEIANGAVVRLAASSQGVREVDRTVETVAARNGGVYSTEHHNAYDPAARPEFIEAHVRRLEAMRKLGRLVERHSDGSWTIPPGHAERGAAFDQAQARPRLEVLSPLPLERLTDARAHTWLDQELLSKTPTALAETGFGHAARDALRQRRAWLIAEGLATAEGARTVYHHDMGNRLLQHELTNAGGELAATVGKRYATAQDGQIEGRYRGPIQLVSGKFAIVERSRDFTLVPWGPVLERQIGKPVRGVQRGESISWTLGRTRGPTIS